MKYLSISIVAAAILIAGAIFFMAGSPNSSPGSGSPTVVNGTQVIDITAKGGYSPRVTVAKADIPTVIKVKTQGTFDCSSALTIPSLNYRTNLQPSGITEIEVPPQKAGTTLRGLCSMGMYNFEVHFN